MDEKDFLRYIIAPTTELICMRSPASDVLLLGTAMVESGLVFLEQKGKGGALGVYQIEKATYADMQRYLNRYDKVVLKKSCLAAAWYDCYPSSDALIHNLRWATIVARVKYVTISPALPKWNQPEAMAAYHKKYYNTAQGDTDVTASVRVFQRAINVCQG